MGLGLDDLLASIEKLDWLCVELQARGYLAPYLDRARKEGWHDGYAQGLRDAHAWPNGRIATRQIEAIDFLYRELAPGEQLGAEMKQRADAAGIASRTLERVRPKVADTVWQTHDGRRAAYWRLRASPTSPVIASGD